MTTLTLELRYVEVDYELWALEHMLGVIETTIERLSKEDEAVTMAALKRGGLEFDDADVDIAFQEVAEKRDYVLPRFVRGPFIVSLWACFESAVQMVAGLRSEEIGAQIKLSHLRGDFLQRANRYYDAVLGLPLETDVVRWQAIRDLYQVRNALAHANGVREGMSAEDWTALGVTLRRHGVELDNHRGLLVLTPAYVDGVYREVDASLRSLLARAREHRPKPRTTRRKQR